MNYLAYKRKYPNVTKNFFSWLSQLNSERIQESSNKTDWILYFLNHHDFSASIQEIPGQTICSYQILSREICEVAEELGFPDTGMFDEEVEQFYERMLSILEKHLSA